MTDKINYRKISDQNIKVEAIEGKGNKWRFWVDI
jgi:hypothetical protein